MVLGEAGGLKCPVGFSLKAMRRGGGQPGRIFKGRSELLEENWDRLWTCT